MAERERSKLESLEFELESSAPEAQPGVTSMVVPRPSGVLPVPAPVARRRAERDERLEPALFSYQLISPLTASGTQRELLKQAYLCWRSVWRQTLEELDGADSIHSDDFTRQHELGCLFYAGQCVGLTGYRWVDLTLAESREDSYFKVWPPSVMKQVLAVGARVCVGSNLTVLADWRGTPGGYSIKEVLMTLAVERFLASDAEVMVGTMRNNRGMNDLVYRLGARPVLQNVVHHGVAVDLVTFSRRALGPIEPSADVDMLTRRLWREAARETT